MNRLKSYLSLALLLTAFSLQSMTGQPAAIVQDEVQVGDSLVFDTLAADTVGLAWPEYAQQEISRLLRHSMFKTSQVGLSVYDLTADSFIVNFNERQLMRPASTMKVITAVTAFDRLSGDYQFKTELCYTGKIENKTLDGNVYCVGGFDPMFNRDDMNAFVEAIRKMGVDTIRGKLYADKSMKDEDTLGEGWCWDDDNPTLSPLLIGREDDFLEVFERELRKSGLVLQTVCANGVKPAGAFCVVRRNHTMDQVVMKMLRESDNLYAEAMFYQIAASAGNRPATAKDARRIIRQLIQKVGLNPNNYRVADGSGLSLYNYVSPELLVRILRHAYRNTNIYAHLRGALPSAGESGTLRKRLRGSFTAGRVWAKTGTVTGISSLSGYCQASNGHLLCFAIINQGLMHNSNGRRFQDKVVEALCSPQ